MTSCRREAGNPAGGSGDHKDGVIGAVEGNSNAFGPCPDNSSRDKLAFSAKFALLQIAIHTRNIKNH